MGRNPIYFLLLGLVLSVFAAQFAEARGQHPKQRLGEVEEKLRKRRSPFLDLPLPVPSPGAVAVPPAPGADSIKRPLPFATGGTCPCVASPAPHTCVPGSDPFVTPCTCSTDSRACPTGCIPPQCTSQTQQNLCYCTPIHKPPRCISPPHVVLPNPTTPTDHGHGSGGLLDVDLGLLHHNNNGHYD